VATGNDRPIVILGCPRSGTTLLQVMLHSHPRIGIPPETRFLLPAYRERLRFGDLSETANRRALGDFIVRTKGHRFGDLGLDRDATVGEIVDGPPTLGSAVGIVLRAYAQRFGRPRWGDKRPAYYNYIDVVMRLFPDARILHVVRDPRDCVASLKRMPWWRTDSYHSVAAWAQSIDNTERAIRVWPGAVTRVQYERLVAEPESELKALCAELGEEYDPAMAEPERLADVAVPERKHWHSNTRVGPTTERVGRWKDDLEPWEASLCETVLAERMARFGYEPAGAGPLGAVHRLRYNRALAAREARRRLRIVKDGIVRRRERNPVAALLTSAERESVRL
jgi:Sulfotransferase family